MVKMWLVDTGCGYDIVSKREVALIKRFVNKAKLTITFHTANGPTVTENMAYIYVKELDENITPYILKQHPTGVDRWVPLRGDGLHFHLGSWAKPVLYPSGWSDYPFGNVSLYSLLISGRNAPQISQNNGVDDMLQRFTFLFLD